MNWRGMVLSFSSQPSHRLLQYKRNVMAPCHSQNLRSPPPITQAQVTWHSNCTQRQVHPLNVASSLLLHVLPYHILRQAQAAIRQEDPTKTLLLDIFIKPDWNSGKPLRSILHTHRSDPKSSSQRCAVECAVTAPTGALLHYDSLRPPR